MGMKVFRSGWLGRKLEEPGKQRRFRYDRILLVAGLVLLLAALVYLLTPIGSQRAVLLGSDARAGEASRSDTILIAEAGGGMLSVPRDTLVRIPGVGEDKLNSAFAYGGPDLTVRTLENLTEVPIDNYAVVNFSGVEDVVNSLGGVTVEVEQQIDVGIEGQKFSISPGTRELNGAQALAYIRYRGGPTADIGRIGRQQRFLSALAREAVSPWNLLRLPATAHAAWSNVETNMNPLQAARFGVQYALWGRGDPVELYPGAPQYIEGISYWVPDENAGQQMVDETIR
jgi:LCP family protein required for cell wall assembly